VIFNSNFKRLIVIVLLGCFISVAQANTRFDPGFAGALPLFDDDFMDITPMGNNSRISSNNLRVDTNSRDNSKEMVVAPLRKMAKSKCSQHSDLPISSATILAFEPYYSLNPLNVYLSQTSIVKNYLSSAIEQATELGQLGVAELKKPIIEFLRYARPQKWMKRIKNTRLYQRLTSHSAAHSRTDTFKRIKKHSTLVWSKTQTFKYQDSETKSIIQALEKNVLGSAAQHISNNEPLTNLGVKVYHWQDDVNNRDEAPSTAALQGLEPRKSAFKNGQSNSEQPISTMLLTSAINRIISTIDNWIPSTFFNGYFWYQADVQASNNSYLANIAWGGGGQYVISFKEHQLVVVITGSDFKDALMAKVSKPALPVFVK